MIYLATQDEITDIGKKNVIELYKNVLVELTQFVYLEKKEITFLVSKCKEEVDIVNNFFIKKPNTILKMIDVYNQISTNIETTSPQINVDNLIKVKYFKAPNFNNN